MFLIYFHGRLGSKAPLTKAAKRRSLESLESLEALGVEREPPLTDKRCSVGSTCSIANVSSWKLALAFKWTHAVVHTSKLHENVLNRSFHTSS